MKFYIGQKVSLLHDSGEGKVISIVDKNHVEVDFGDDFAFDVHVDEIIPVTPEQDKFFSKPEEKHEAETRVAPQALGIRLIDISLAITRETGTEYKLQLINPESYEILYTVFEKRKHKYQGLAYGKVDAGGKDLIGIFTDEHLKGLKNLYFQLIFFKQGVMMPQAPLVCSLPWTNQLLEKDFYSIKPLGTDGLLISLRKGIEASAEKEEEEIQKKDAPAKTGGERVVDLHIEELTIFPHQLTAKEKLEVQLEHFDKSLSDALIANVNKMIAIHGIGEGKLRMEIRNRLKENPHVKSYYPANHQRFGNGATEIIFE
jgi:hypothetical protein